MRLGISTWVYANLPLDVALSKLAAKGFHILELWADQSQLDPRFFPESGLNRIRELGSTLNLKFHPLHAPFTGLDIASLDESRRDESIRRVFQALEYAAELKCPQVVVHPGSGDSMTIKDDDSEPRNRILDALRRINERAKRYDIRVLLENMTQVQGRRYGSRIRDLVDLTEAFGSENLGLCLDPGHAILSGLNVYDELREADGLLQSLHANDNDGVKDLHLVPLSTKGLINWRRFLRVLKDIGYRRPFMLEVYGGEDPDGVVEDARSLCEKLSLCPTS